MTDIQQVGTEASQQERAAAPPPGREKKLPARDRWVVIVMVAVPLFLVLALVYPAGLGMGDVKLAAFLGAWLGWDAFVGLFVGTLLGMLPALVILVSRGSAGRRTTLPYVPALAAGAVVGLFFGDAILDAWLN